MPSEIIKYANTGLLSHNVKERMHPPTKQDVSTAAAPNLPNQKEDSLFNFLTELEEGRLVFFTADVSGDEIQADCLN